MAAKSSARASGWPWKLPPLIRIRGAVLGEEDARVVGHAVQLAREHLAHEGQRVARGAVHLGHAPQGVGVLHLPAVLVALHDLAVGEHGAEVLGHHELPRMRAGDVQALVEGPCGALERLQAHRAGDVRRGGEALGVQQREGAQGGHELRAVDEGQPLLRLEDHRLDAGALQRRGRGLPAGLREPLDPVRGRAFQVRRLPLPDHRQRQVREGRQVSGGPDRPTRGDARDDTAVEHLHQDIDHRGAHPGVAEREDLRAKEHHPAHDRGLQRSADARRVRADQVPLQGADVVGGDPRLAQRTEAGVDAIDVGRRVPGGGDGVDGGARPAHALAGLGSELHRPPATRHVLQIGELEGTA